jgi:hypothetical protein
MVSSTAGEREGMAEDKVTRKLAETDGHLGNVG